MKKHPMLCFICRLLSKDVLPCPACHEMVCKAHRGPATGLCTTCLDKELDRISVAVPHDT